MKISRENVLRVAELAYLELTPEEIETYQGQLDGILTYIEKLNELDVQTSNRWRKACSSSPKRRVPPMRILNCARMCSVPRTFPARS